MQSYCNIQLITSQSILSSFLEQMTPLFSTTATLSCASTTTSPKLSIAKSLFNSRCPNRTGPFVVLEAESAFLANTPRKWKPYELSNVRFLQQKKPLVVCISYSCTRAYFGGDSGNTPEAENDDNGSGDERSEQDACDPPPDFELLDDGIEIAIEKTGKNSRRITSKVAVQASLQTVWDILTDYERLADFIPGLAVSQLLEKRDKFARLFQIGEQNLAFGLKFNAKGIIDCFEKDLQTLPFGQKRDIEFKMVEGDFQLFEGKWSIEQEVKQNPGDSQSDSVIGEEYQTTLLYIVLVKPKVWLPVRLVEGRLCKEIRSNLSCIREEAEKAFQNTNFAL
ncbi:uncharacterized protein LOC105162824 isoform X2 [Sesamum indicum]|uniref:Uncharacterized protein LOC105162824 isoform X2 n=1 Tax=Sesamum indicum TaxID=4182 RepID=A0A6I9T7N5_SESIN|nr:uncharacterized protein LOC105162824 isoform X2 [Sesamum indicum]